MKRRSEFVDMAICQPVRLLHRARKAASVDVASVEVQNWLLLAAQIGYIGEEDARHLGDSTWQALLGALDKFTRPGNKVHANLDYDAFHSLALGPFKVLYDDGPREAALNVFQSVLLLVSESLFDVESLNFLDAIGWSDGQQWNASLKNENGKNTFQGLASGFANVLAFLEGLQTLSSSWQFVVPMEISNLSFQFENEAKLEERDLVGYVLTKTTQIVRPRFNLDESEVWLRYVALAGDFVKRTDNGTREWQDSARNSFNNLLSLLGFIGSQPAPAEELWRVFRAGNSPTPSGRHEGGAQQSGAW